MPIKLVGRDNVSPGSYETAAQLVLSKFTAVNTGYMTVFYVRINASGNVKGGIYSDSSGSPNALLNSVGSTAVSSGWNAITFPSTSIASGTVYWLAIVTDTASCVGAVNETSVRKYKAWTYSNALPDPAGTGYSDETTWQDIFQGADPGTLTPSGVISTIVGNPVKVTSYKYTPSGNISSIVGSPAPIASYKQIVSGAVSSIVGTVSSMKVFLVNVSGVVSTVVGSLIETYLMGQIVGGVVTSAGNAVKALFKYPVVPDLIVKLWGRSKTVLMKARDITLKL
jgi:hypothetical protein